jgi:hypothetical protein
MGKCLLQFRICQSIETSCRLLSSPCSCFHPDRALRRAGRTGVQPNFSAHAGRLCPPEVPRCFSKKPTCCTALQAMLACHSSEFQNLVNQCAAARPHFETQNFEQASMACRAV